MNNAQNWCIDQLSYHFKYAKKTQSCFNYYRSRQLAYVNTVNLENANENMDCG